MIWRRRDSDWRQQGSTTSSLRERSLTCVPHFGDTAAMAIDWVSRGIGGAGVAMAMLTWWSNRPARRGTRPIVICEEMTPPQEVREGGRLAATVRLRNSSDATAYNLRLGLQLSRARISWGQEMSDPPRLNHLSPGVCTDAQPVLVPPGWAFERPTDPWPERQYWVDYQDGADQWWTTRNPWQGTQDLKVRRVGGRLRWWLHRRVQARRHDRAVRRGKRAARKSRATP